MKLFIRFFFFSIIIFIFILVDCLQPDDSDTGICIPENQPLCSLSEIFTYKCLHICGIC